MAKKFLLVWVLVFFASSQIVPAQTDTAATISADSAGVNLQQKLPPQPPKKVKTWPVATAVALILLSTYLLYNVRSR